MYKLRFIRPYKNTICLENYLVQLRRKEAIAIFKLRTGMLKVKTNFRSQHENLYCERCKEQQIEDENHLLTCVSLQELRDIFQVNSFNAAFRSIDDNAELNKIASYLLVAEVVE